jgi:hypothetical protein
MNPEQKNVPQKPEDEKPVNKTEIEPLSDQALEDVAGGVSAISSDSCCSCTGCS